MAVMWWMPSSFTVSPSLLRAQQYSTVRVPRHAQAATGVYHWVALLIAAGGVVQFLLAGAGVFGAESFDAHESLGWMLHTASLVVLIAAIAGPRTRRAIVLAVVFVVVFTIQVM